jgi:hypothetical protein
MSEALLITRNRALIRLKKAHRLDARRGARHVMP